MGKKGEGRIYENDDEGRIDGTIEDRGACVGVMLIG